VVADEVETSTCAGLEELPTLDAPTEPTIRPVPTSVTAEPETAVTLPEVDAREKPPPPKPPPPKPPPPPKRPLPLPPKPVLPVKGHGEPAPLITTERAATGPAAEPFVGGVPVTATQPPTVTSCAVADTVWE